MVTYAQGAEWGAQAVTFAIVPVPPVFLTSRDDEPGASRLAEELGLLLVREPPADGLVLRFHEGRLELADLTPGAPGPLRVDFVGGAMGHRLRARPSRDEPLARAVGLKRHGPRSVVDATPGLGRDSMLLAQLGCDVYAVERSAVAVALLRDGLARASREPGLRAAVGRVSLELADARVRLGELRPPPAVVLLDPMFPERRSSALVRKEMRLLREAVGTDDDASELFAVARRVATERVVVRRPAGAPPLSDPQRPDLSFGGRRTRLDVYLAAPPTAPPTAP